MDVHPLGETDGAKDGETVGYGRTHQYTEQWTDREMWMTDGR